MRMLWVAVVVFWRRFSCQARSTFLQVMTFQFAKNHLSRLRGWCGWRNSMVLTQDHLQGGVRNVGAVITPLLSSPLLSSLCFAAECPSPTPACVSRAVPTRTGSPEAHPLRLYEASRRAWWRSVARGTRRIWRSVARRRTGTRQGRVRQLRASRDGRRAWHVHARLRG